MSGGALSYTLPFSSSRSPLGWFTLDLVSILPYNVIGLTTDKSQGVSKLKLLKVVRRPHSLSSGERRRGA